MSFPFLRGCSALRVRSDGIIEALAGAEIDADGANGQNGLPPCYAPHSYRGATLDDLANAGHPGNWYGVLTDTGRADGEPIIQGDADPCPGAYISTTALRLPGSLVGGTAALHNPRLYVDAAAVPAIVVPPCVIAAVPGIVLGCAVKVTHMLNHATVDAVVFDVGPHDQFGEISPALARRLGIHDSARTGGESRKIIRYEIMPGVAAVVDDVTYPLQHH